MKIPLRSLAHLTAAATLQLGAITARAHPEPLALAPSAPGEPAFFLAQADPPRNASATRAAASYETKNRVSITLEDGMRVIRSNGWPDHEPGAFPRKGNPNAARPQDYTFRVPLKPTAAPSRERRPGWFFAVAVNGVPFEPGTAEAWNNDRSSGWHYEANTGFLDLGLDEHNAHVQPNGAYHYHALPTGLIERLGGDGKKMLLVAWAADGFPVYTAYGLSDPTNLQSPVRKMKSSYHVRSGARPATPGGPGGNYDGRFTEDWQYTAGSGDLDELNGRFGVTPEFPQGVYHYYITAEFPSLARQWRGTPDASFSKGEGLPPGGPGRTGGAPQGTRPGGRPPTPPVITALDANGDGKIDAAEMNAAPAALRRLDRNGDGVLTLDELLPPGPRGGRMFPEGSGPGAPREPR